MSIKKADHAIARFTEPMATEAEKVTGAQTHIASIKASVNWAAATGVQTATDAWATSSWPREGTAHDPASTPVGVTARKSKVSRAVGWQWFLTPKNRYGFMVQHATNVADPSTYSSPMSCSKRSFKLLLQTRGTAISLRVMALDPTLPTGQSDWSAWAPNMVGA